MTAGASAGVFSDYPEAAMRGVRLDQLDDGTWAGTLALCPDVFAFGATREECEQDLRSVLEGWVWLGLRMGHPLPVIDGIDLNMEPSHESLESV